MLLEENVDKGPGLGSTSQELDNSMSSHVANTTKEKRSIQLKIKRDLLVMIFLELVFCNFYDNTGCMLRTRFPAAVLILRKYVI